MKNELLASLGRLSDNELVTRIKNLIGRERDASAHVVAHLAELDTREVHVREGYRSLYIYCRDALGLSEWEAYARIEVARAARRFPVILDMLVDGSVHVTALKLLAPHLTPDNHLQVLESARGKTKLQVQAIVAGIAPRPDVPSSVRRVAPASSQASVDPPAVVSLAREAPDTASPGTVSEATVPLAQPPAVRASVAPLSPDRFRLQVTIGGDTLEKLRCAQDMLGHAIPSGDEAAVLDRALTALLVELAKKKFAYTPNPRPPRGAKTGDPSAAVKRAVWMRDCGRCRFVGAGGHRCDERRFIEFHHLDPKALGGAATADNIELRCRRHNDHEGQLWFGKRRQSGHLGPDPVQLSVTRSGS